MKKIHIPLPGKRTRVYPYLFSFLCLIFCLPLQAQLPSDEQSLVEQAIENTTQQIPLLQPFLDAINLGAPVTITNTESTFKFKQERTNVPFATILNDLATAIGGSELSALLNNPVIIAISDIFTNNSITATFTIQDLNSTPRYSVSLLGAASGLEFEFYFGRGVGNTDFVLAIAPSEMNFADIHTALTIFDGFADPNVGLFIAKTSSEITPDMAILQQMELTDFSLSTGLMALVNLNVEEASDIGAMFKVDHLLATAQIPDNITAPLALTASIVPNWDLGPNASIGDLTLTMNAGYSEGKIVIEQSASLTLDTKLPSSLTDGATSDVSWKVQGSISVSPDDTGIVNCRIAGFGNMEGTWSTPFGINELDINSVGCELGINVEVKVVPTPAGPAIAVTVLPDLGIRGDMNIGRTRAIKLAMAGKIDIATPYASGVYGHFTNLGLGTVLSELYLSEIGEGINPTDLASLDKVFVEYGKISLFPAGAEIAGESYSAGIGFAGKGKAFDLGCDISAFFEPTGAYGELSIDPIKWDIDNQEVFSLRGTNPDDPLKASLNLQFNSLASQISDAFNGIPFLVADAYVGLLGSSSQTKLVLNPIHGSYFSTNSKLLNLLDIKMEGEAPSLLQFGDMKIRGAFDKAPTEEINKAIIQFFDNAIRGLIPTERIEELNAAIAAKQNLINTTKQQIHNERATNIAQLQVARDDVQGLQNQYNILTAQAEEKWRQYNETPWWDINTRSALWAQTTDLNIQKEALLIGINTAINFLNDLIWISSLPPVDLDPRVSKLEVEKLALLSEKEVLVNLDHMGNTISGMMRDAHAYFMANGIMDIIDVRQAEFQGNLNLLSGGELDLMVNMVFMGNEISLNSKVKVNYDGTFDVGSIIKDLLNNQFIQGFSPSFAAEIGTKYNYSTSIATVHPITPPQNGNYTPPVTNPNPAPVGTAGNTDYLDTHDLTFNGTTDYHEKVGNWGSGWTEMTIEAWVKSNGSNGGFQTIVSGNEGFAHFQMAPNGNGNNVVYLSNGVAILLPTLPDATTEWRHVAIVAKSGESKVYQNGELIGQPNYLGFGDGTIMPTGHIRLGGNKGYGRYLNGQLADVRIWNKARTQAEIKAGMHNAPSVNTPGLVAAYGTAAIAQLEDLAQCFNNQTNMTIPGNYSQNLTEMTIEAWVKNESGGDNIQAIVSSANLDFIHLQASDDPNVQCAVYVNEGEVYLPAIPRAVGQWQHVAVVVGARTSQLYINGLPYGSMNTMDFVSIRPASNILIGKGFGGGRSFNGKIANVRIWSRARDQQAIANDMLRFDLVEHPALLYHSPMSHPLTVSSASDCVAIPANATSGPLHSLTVEAWINNSSVQNDIQAIVSATGPEFVHLQMSGDGNVNNAVYLDNGGSIMLPVIPVTTPGWHHVAMVVESGNSRVYLDGEQIGATDTTTFTALKPSQSVFIGKGWAGGRVFNGKIADVRIWKNRTLTQPQIQTYRFTPPPASANSLAFHYK